MHNKTILTFNIIAAILPQQKPGWPNPRIEINAVCSFCDISFCQWPLSLQTEKKRHRGHSLFALYRG